MTPELFSRLVAAGYNRIPLIRELLADLETPLSIYLKLAHAPFSYLFESVQGGEKWGRYSIIGLPARVVLTVRGHEVRVQRDGRTEEQATAADPLAWIEQWLQRIRVPTAAELGLSVLPRFAGGLVGYFAYDTIRYVEPRLGQGEPRPDPLNAPDILLMQSDELVVFDNLRGRIQLIVHAEPGGLEHALARLDELEQRLRAPLHYPRHPHRPREISERDFVSGFTEDGFQQAVRTAKDYIAAGDVMQVVLSQRLTVPYAAPPLDLYRALRGINPSPYLFFLDLDEMSVVGASPEILVRLEQGEVTVRPIAGTRRRGATEAEDQALEAELLADPKERAEHLMLIDLGRNDIGRVCETGSVRLTEKMVIERYSHVMHIVSNVTGKLRPGLSAMDVLRATFPAGTVSGAPKVRAMEIIDELEPVKRGVYAGAVGYLGWHHPDGGAMDTAISIRTAVIKDGELHIQAGAGIVHDSAPEAEWQETMSKGRAVFRAVTLAEAGLDATGLS